MCKRKLFSFRREWIILFGSLFIFSGSFGQVTFPVNGIADPRENCYAFVHATIVKDAETSIQDGILVIRKGKIIASGGSKTAIPQDAVTIDCSGKYIYPSFIDLYTDYGVPALAQRGAGFDFRSPAQLNSASRGAYGWNQAIRPETDASKIFVADNGKAGDLRSSGFGVVLTHQQDGIARGTGTLVTLTGERENFAMLKDKAAAYYSFNTGTSTQDYPNSLMGCIALLRQTYLDAQWYKTRPATEGTNLSLQAWNDNQSLPQIFDASDKWNDLRAVKIANAYPNTPLILGHWGFVDAPDFSPFNGDPEHLKKLVVNPERIIVLAPGQPYQLKRLKK